MNQNQIGHPRIAGPNNVGPREAAILACMKHLAVEIELLEEAANILTARLEPIRTLTPEKHPESAGSPTRPCRLADDISAAVMRITRIREALDRVTNTLEI